MRTVPEACPVFCVSGLQVGVDSVGVGGGELGQGLVPVGGDLSFDESALGFALGWWQSFLLVAFSGSFVHGCRRSPAFASSGHRLITGEVAAVLGDLAQLVVQRLDAVGRVYDAPEHRREVQEGSESLPGPLAGRHRLGVLDPMSDSEKSVRACQAASWFGAV